MDPKAIVLLVLGAVHPSAIKTADPAVVDAMVVAGSELCDKAGEDACRLPVALMTYYAWRESQAQTHPRPMSWDAKAGVSCGPWQMRCAMTSKLSLAGQARAWLLELRTSGLASLDSSKSRAERRTAIVMQILEPNVHE